MLELQSLFGLRVVRSRYVPKRKIPIQPRTGDMRAMVDALCERGEARAQFKEIDQVIIMNGQVIASDSVFVALENIT